MTFPADLSLPVFFLSIFLQIEAGPEDQALEGVAPSKNVVLFFLDDPTLDAMRSFSRIHLYQRKIDGSVDSSASDPNNALFYTDLPRIETMAREGVAFTEFRAMPYCSPSRACLLTGMYPFKRHGQGAIQRPAYLWDDHLEFGSQPGFVYPVIADFLHAAGMQALMVGKWHLSQRLGEPASPNLSGLLGTGWSHINRSGRWDSYIATFGNLRSQPIPDKNGQPASSSSGSYYHYFLDNNGTLQEVTNPENEQATAPSNRDNRDRTGYVTRTQAIDIVRAINSHSPEDRFFLYAPLNSIHTPLQAPPVDMVRTPYFQVSDQMWPLSQGGFRNAQAMMEAVDYSIGYVLDNMTPSVRAQTVFMLAGDNGTSRLALKLFDADLSPGLGSSGSLGESYKYVMGNMENNLPPGASPALGPKKNQGRLKTSCFERGVRAPLIIWDPSGEVIPNPSRDSAALADIVDLMPTILDIMGAEYVASSLDGISLLPILTGTATRETHRRQYSFAETYAPTGTGPSLNPRNHPDFIGEWNQALGPIPPGKIVSYHNNLVRFFKALTTTTTASPFPLQSTGEWQVLATMQRSFILNVTDVDRPGTYKIVRNYFEDTTEFVDRFYRLYDGAFNAVDPIEAYELDQLTTYAAEYQAVRAAFDRFLRAAPPSAPIF